MRMTIVFLYVCAILFLNPSAAADLRTREDDLHETLLDVTALVKSGISRNDLKKTIPDLTIKFDRYIRSGGKRYGSLYDAVNAFKKADEAWDARLREQADGGKYDPQSRYTLDQLNAESVRRHFNDALQALDLYVKEQANLKSSKSPSTKKSKSGQTTDNPANVFEDTQNAFKAQMEAIDEELKAKKKALDARRACHYTNPPSCAS